MTMPDERTRSVIRARELLRDLLDPKKTPKVPKIIRQRAFSALKHFPWNTHLEDSARKLPDVWGPNG